MRAHTRFSLSLSQKLRDGISDSSKKGNTHSWSVKSYLVDCYHHFFKLGLAFKFATLCHWALNCRYQSCPLRHPEQAYIHNHSLEFEWPSFLNIIIYRLVHIRHLFVLFLFSVLCVFFLSIFLIHKSLLKYYTIYVSQIRKKRVFSCLSYINFSL